MLITPRAPNFHDYEFYCLCGKCDPTEMSMRIKFVERLQKLRDVLGVPLCISDGLRCFYMQYYIICGGEPGNYYVSEHQLGNAADVFICGRNSIGHMIEVAVSAIQVGFKRVGFYPHSYSKFVHVDMGDPSLLGESWIRDVSGIYTYYEKFDEALSQITLGDFAGNYT